MPKVELAGGPHVNLVRTGPRGGVPILFLHALGPDLTWWDQQTGAFGRDHDVIGIDLPGHGLPVPRERRASTIWRGRSPPSWRRWAPGRRMWWASRWAA